MPPKENIKKRQVLRRSAVKGRQRHTMYRIQCASLSQILKTMFAMLCFTVKSLIPGIHQTSFLTIPTRDAPCVPRFRSRNHGNYPSPAWLPRATLGRVGRCESQSTAASPRRVCRKAVLAPHMFTLARFFFSPTAGINCKRWHSRQMSRSQRQTR